MAEADDRPIAERTGELGVLTSQSFAALLSPPYEIGQWVRQMEQIGVRSLGGWVRSTTVRRPVARLSSSCDRIDGMVCVSLHCGTTHGGAASDVPIVRR